MPTPNVGTIDRTLRISFGLLLIALTAMQTIGLWGLVGFVPLLTGLARVCPLYSLIGVSTCPKEARAR
jgi:hypothetical protein